MPRFMLQTAIAVIVALVGLVSFSPPPITAHAAFVASNPAPESTVSSAPAQVSIAFSQSVSRSGSAITVTGPDGSTVSGETAVNGAVTSTPTRAAGSGTYVVRWANVSVEDGHAADGSFSFTVAGTASRASPAPLQPGSRPAPQSATTAPPSRQPAAAAPARPAQAMPRSGTGATFDSTLPAGVGASAVAAMVVAALLAPAIVLRRTRRY